jgi:lipid II:glycine glycyltransferase (peptidoglycan interpeptide bridge formation enzyme)
VTQARYQEVAVKNGNQFVGRLPFVVTRRMGFTELRMPPFTHVLGPAVDAGKGKPQTQLLKRLSIVRELLDQLPRFDFFKQALHAATADGLAFQDRGFQISPQYTFRIDCRRDPQEIWQDMHFKTRQHIRRAEEKLAIDTVEDPGEFVGFYQANLEKQGRRNHLDFSPFATLFEEARRRDCGKILCARWPDGRPTAMVYIVWGHGTMYYLLSTRSSDVGDNGSINLLIWSAIKYAHGRGLVFDFDGVSSSGTARFLSGFGGQPEMRLIARRSTSFYGLLQFAKRKFIGGQADETHAYT